jgi:hypothetical protein
MWRAHDRRNLRQPRTRGPAPGFTGQSMARRARQAAIVKPCDALFRSLQRMCCTSGFMFSDRSIRYCSDTDCNSASRPPIIGPPFAANAGCGGFSREQFPRRLCRSHPLQADRHGRRSVKDVVCRRALPMPHRAIKKKSSIVRSAEAARCGRGHIAMQPMGA